MDINQSLKSDFKNYSDWSIYVSENRPAQEILNSLPRDKNCWAWEKNNRFAICSHKLSDKEVKSADLKEYNFRFMDFKDNQVKINFRELFDERTFDLKEASDRDIAPYFKDWRTLADIDKAASEVETELDNGDKQ